MDEIDRRLVFYRWRSVEGLQPFDRLAAASDVSHLADDKERPLRQGAFLIDVTVNECGDKDAPTKLTVMKLRSYDERAWVRAPGELGTPVAMRPDQNMEDYSHAILWGDGFAAFALGGHAPTPSAFMSFLLARTGHSIDLVPLYEKELVERLLRWKGVRGVALRITNSLAVQTQLNQSKGSFRGLIGQLRGEVTGAVLRSEIAVEKGGSGARQRILATSVEDVVELAQLSETFDSLQVRGLTKDGSVEKFDLIKQRLQVSCRLPRAQAGGHRTDDGATFQAILDARKRVDNDGRLEKAAEGITT